MAEIILPPGAESQMASKSAIQTSTHEISLDQTKQKGVTFALQWPNGMNSFLIVPSISRIQGELKKRGWQTSFNQYDALMLATCTMSLPKGTITYPEKAAEDWAAAVSGVNGTINLGIVPDTPITINADVPDIKETVRDGVSYGVQWPKDMNQNLIIPKISLIENYLKSKGWQVGTRNLQAIMMATFTLSLPKGTITYPEKAGKDWTAAIAQVNGIINLGLLSGEVTIQSESQSRNAAGQFAVQWPENMNQNLIVPLVSMIKGEFEKLGWEVTYQIYDALRIVIFSLYLPKGHHTYPEKAAEDWEKVVGQLHGWTNLGSVSGEVTTN